MNTELITIHEPSVHGGHHAHIQFEKSEWLLIFDFFSKQNPRTLGQHCAATWSRTEPACGLPEIVLCLL